MNNLLFKAGDLVKLNLPWEKAVSIDSDIRTFDIRENVGYRVFADCHEHASYIRLDLSATFPTYATCGVLFRPDMWQHFNNVSCGFVIEDF